MNRLRRYQLVALCGVVQWALTMGGSAPAVGQFKVDVEGQTHTVIPARKLAEYLRTASGDTAITFERAIVQGRIFAPTMGLDTVRAAIDFTGARFEDEVFLDEVVFLRPVRLAQSQFEDGLSCRGARFEDDVNFSGSHFERHANFKQADLRQNADFSNCRFSKSAAFVDAAFRGAETSFAGARFEDKAYCENAVFTGRANFKDAAFGHVASFKETRWQAPASFAGARFVENALFWQARFDDEALFDTAYFRRQAAFNKAVFSGLTSFRQAVFIRAGLFTQVRFLDEAFFAESQFKRAADFSHSEFKKQAQLGATFNRGLNLQHCKGPLADLRLFSVPREERGDSTAVDSMRVYLQDAHFDKILVNWSQLAGRLASRDSSGIADLEPVYATLRHHFKIRGLHRDADAAMVEWLELKRRALPLVSGEGLMLHFMRLSSNYGTTPWRLGGLAAGCIIAFALCYRFSRTSLHSLDQGGTLNLADCTYLSLFVFFLLGTARWRAVGKVRFFVGLQAILGWTTWALAIAALVRYLLR